MVANGDEMHCSHEECGHTEAKDATRAKAFISTEEQTDPSVIETEAGAADEGKPTAEVLCEKCENNRAWYIIKQTASADEPPTRFFKCTECGHRWRDYG